MCSGRAGGGGGDGLQWSLETVDARFDESANRRWGKRPGAQPQASGWWQHRGRGRVIKGPVSLFDPVCDASNTHKIIPSTFFITSTPTSSCSCRRRWAAKRPPPLLTLGSTLGSPSGCRTFCYAHNSEPRPGGHPAVQILHLASILLISTPFSLRGAEACSNQHQQQPEAPKAIIVFHVLLMWRNFRRGPATLPGVSRRT